MVIPDILTRVAAKHPTRVACCCEGKMWTYEQVARRVGALAAFLTQRGVKAGDRVALLEPNCHRFLESYFAVAAAGAIAVPINCRLAPREVAFVLQDSGSCALIGHGQYRAAIERADASLADPLGSLIWAGRPADPLADARHFDYEIAIDETEPGPGPARGTDPHAVAQIYYTSGTTGRAKGVMLTHQNVCQHAESAIQELGLTGADRWIHAAPMFHLADGWATWAITWVGGRHVFVPRFEAGTVLDAIEQQRVTATNLIPTMLSRLLQEQLARSRDVSSMRLMMTGGAPIAPELVRRAMAMFPGEYVQTYGMTETAPYLTLSVLAEDHRQWSSEAQLLMRAKVGRAFRGVDLRVVGAEGRDVAPDDTAVGEIWVRGSTVSPGYWRLPEETAAAFDQGWLRTGDLATIDAHGFVSLVGRKSDLIITGGENVYPAEVENVLFEHSAVLEAAVLGVPDPEWGETVRAVVVLKAGQWATAAELVAFCRERLAAFKVPKRVLFCAELPKTGSGKVSRFGLKEAFGQNRAPDESV